MRLLIASLLLGTAALYSTPLPAAPWDRAEIVRRLRQQEQLVDAIDCRLTQIDYPTSTEMVAKIRKWQDGQAPERGMFSYISSATVPKRRRIHFRCSGIRERSDVYGEGNLGGVKDVPTRCQAYDGRVVRGVQADGDQLYGSIDLPDNWLATNFEDPKSFLYWFQQDAYSDLIQRAPRFSMTEITDNGHPAFAVQFAHARFPTKEFTLILDSECRILRRDEVYQFPGLDPEPRLYQRLEFLDYAQHLDASGEAIHFPRRIVSHYYAATLEDGTHLEYDTREFLIESIKFNVPIPDETFVIEFPPGTRVWDGVHGLGYLDEGVDPENPLAPRSSAWKIALAVAVAVLTACVALWLVHRRLRPRRRLAS